MEYKLAKTEDIQKYVNKAREIFINSKFKYKYEANRTIYINAYAEALANVEGKTIHS